METLSLQSRSRLRNRPSVAVILAGGLAGIQTFSFCIGLCRRGLVSVEQPDAWSSRFGSTLGQPAVSTSSMAASSGDHIHAQAGGSGKRMKAFYINTQFDEPRRRGMEAMCESIQIDCERVPPPGLSSKEVVTCVAEADLSPFECSLVHAHRHILSTISSMSERVIVFEDDARLNLFSSPGEARELLASITADFVMGGWCDPSCAHAYIVSPAGAKKLLANGFEEPTSPADCVFPLFEPCRPWADIEAAGGELLFPHGCPGGFPTDLGLFCQDRSYPHCNAYFLADFARTDKTVFE